MKYFKNFENLEELKKQYKELAKKLHPDHGGDIHEFQEMLNEYHKLLNGEFEKSDIKEETREILRELLEIQEILIEVVGSWVWVSGETKKYKDLLKKLNFKWSGKRLMWYLAPEGKKSKSSNKSFEEIKAFYGSETLGKGRNKKEFVKIKY